MEAERIGVNIFPVNVVPEVFAFVFKLFWRFVTSETTWVWTIGENTEFKFEAPE